MTQFMIHLRNDSKLLQCGRDSLIRVLPTFIDLAAEGAAALGVDTAKINPPARKARKIATIAGLFQDKNYPTAAREVISLYWGDRKLSPRVSAFAGVLDAMASADTLALAAALERTMSPVGGWREKSNGATHWTITAYAGFGPQWNWEPPHKLQYGIKVPVGAEYTGTLFGVMASALDLGHMLSADGSSVDWTWEDILTPGLFLRCQPVRSPVVIFAGAEWRNENWTGLAGLAVDVTLWRL